MHSDGSGLISGAWNILAAAIGPVFLTSVITLNVMPFAAHCDADSKNRKLLGSIDEADLAYLAELQKLWLQVPPRCSTLHTPHVTLPAHTASSHSTLPVHTASSHGFGRVRLGYMP
jgi:hypothetical protein